MVRMYVFWTRVWPLLMVFASFVLLFFLLSTSSYKVTVAEDGKNDQHTQQPTRPLLELQEESGDELNYGIVIDAGSTGSRLFLYSWPSRIESQHALISIRPVVDERNKPVVKKVSPGLSEFASAPENATEYIRPLLNLASSHVPPAKHAATPVFIFATAGMRLLEESEQEAILKNLRTELLKLFSFQILPEHIQVISGKWEGAYSWIAVNYIMGKFDANVFRFGVNEGRKRYEQLISDELLSKKSDKPSSNGTVSYSDPCLPINLVRMVQREDGSSFTRKGNGRWSECYRMMTDLLSREECQNALPCFFGDVNRPPDVNMGTTQMYGFSEFWYSLEDVLSLGGQYNYGTAVLEAEAYCSQRWSKIQERSRKGLYPKADDDRLKTNCFKSAWALAMLHDGFHIPKTTTNFRTAFKIQDQEVQWALGAMLYHMRYFPLRDIQRKKLERLKSGQDQDSHANKGNIKDSVNYSVLHSPGARYYSDSLLFSTEALSVFGLCFVAFFLYKCCYVGGGNSLFGRQLPCHMLVECGTRGSNNNNNQSASSAAAAAVLPRRNASMWGYMMLNQEEDESLAGVRVEKSSNYVY